ncbi:YegJ family protein [Lysobacter silvisoli]|uniref:DUF2314 domain-containing protein n=1 Tax=Lysobacter silvisoli TaxID=2293254 RepID=A0A371K5S8_9GAMM|nr:DUF2314 domain-containing protein [Lysobacter silvisoli]RDZ29224.1 DUF2314 domain-containing protein [Lysobacter silvisoli]
MHKTVIAMALACAFGAADAQTLVERAQRDEVALTRAEDPKMQAAYAKARAGLDEFLALQREPPAHLTGFSVKVGVKEGERTEFFWMGDLQVEGEGYSAVIDNKPRIVHRVHMGERYAFAREEIVDWTYRDSERQATHGNFTACALIARESPEQAEAFKLRFGLSCD